MAYFVILMCLLMLAGLYAAIVISVIFAISIIVLIVCPIIYWCGGSKDKELLGIIGVFLVAFIITGGIMLAIMSK